VAGPGVAASAAAGSVARLRADIDRSKQPPRAVVEPVSPELALVDEELDRAARIGLPERPGRLAAGASTAPARRPKRRAITVGGVLAALAVGLCTLLLVLAGSDGTQPTSTVAERAGEAAGASRFQLRWKPVRGARLYNVILWKGGERVLDLWPASASVRVPKRRLEPGTYQWFVYPLLGEGQSRRYGRVVARGTLKA
jgi:hypothetical protein